MGIIGGSGVDDPKILNDFAHKKAHTPYGAPSEKLTVGTYRGVKVVIVPRHGEGHRFNPTAVNYRANVWALREEGVTHLVAPTACGSLREGIKPGDLVFVDQFIDRTTRRVSTFYEGHQVCHIPMAEPFCPKLRAVLIEAAKAQKVRFHPKGTIVTIEGPRFSTRAESHLFRSWDADAINMTTVPEAVLAREAGICYQPIAMSTDYDCWHQSEDPVTVEMILRTMRANAEAVKALLLAAIPKLTDWPCDCRTAIQSAVL